MQSDYRPSRFQVLPPVIKNLIIINALIWLAQITVGRSIIPIEDLFALHYFKTPYYHPWQFLTYMFLHSPESPFHIIFNMFALWMFGSTLENLWGSKRFILFYLICGIGAGLVHMGAMTFDFAKIDHELLIRGINPREFYDSVRSPTLGASGAVMGIFAAYAYTFPNNQLIIFPIPIPIKAKWALLGLVAIDLFGGISSQQSGIAHFAHIGGAAVA
jgi:membrane associated rhomboid family serine protease